MTDDDGVIQVQGLLFDNDGVLIDSTEAVESSWRAFADWYGLPRDELLTRVHGRRSRDVIGYYADRLPVSAEEAFARYIRACVEEYASVTVLPGAAELLASLPPAGWAVVTSGTRIVTQARMASAGLPAPPVLVTAEDVSVGKPDPAPYQLAATRLGLDTRACLVIEDSAPGLESGRAAGCHTLALHTTHRNRYSAADLDATDLTGIRIDHDGQCFRVYSI
jgi:sugar-phosphatase